MDNEKIIALIDAHAERSGFAPTTITQRAVVNPHLYTTLKNGGSVTLRTLARLQKYLKDNRNEQNPRRKDRG